MDIDSVDLVIVGAGAAGLIAAIAATRACPGTRILVIEGCARPARKLLVSGGGRCNITNSAAEAAAYSGGDPTFVRRVLLAFPVSRTAAFFEAIGVPLREGAEGRMYPASDRAGDVAAALLREASRCGVELRCGWRVTDVEGRSGAFRIVSPRGNAQARKVLLATGGLVPPGTGCDGVGYEIARRLGGHSLVQPLPSLVPFELESRFHRPLAGVSHDASLAVLAGGRRIAQARGAVLWTHDGISGPAALDISRSWARAREAGQDVTLRLNFVPGETVESAEAALLEQASESGRSGVQAAISRVLPGRVARAILAGVGIDPATRLARFPRSDRRRLLQALLDWPLAVKGTKGWKDAEVTAGGVPLDEVHPVTLESRLCPGLHFAGEILDVDGRVGGFNLQWAWSSGWVAGRMLARP